MMRLVAGWGFRSSAAGQSFASCWSQAHQELQALSVPVLAPGPWAHALLESRTQTPAWAEFAAWAAEQTPDAALLRCEECSLQAITTPTASARVQQRFGCGSVSEALAMNGAEQLMQQWSRAPEYVADASYVSPCIRLILQRILSADRQATLAIAYVMGVAPASPSFETGVIS